ncbi:glycosyltransferase family 4 protein [Desulfobacterales bacterium]|nr:glycosyltransferase family 4 protein [Desulfobacterales bacterium]
MKTLFLTRAMPPPFMGGAGTYYYNIFNRFPKGDLTIFTEKSRAKITPKKGDGIRYIRRSYIRANLPPTGIHRQIRQIPGMVKLSNFYMIFLWGIELTLYCILNRPNVIYIGQLFPTGILGLTVCRFLKIPYIVFVHGEELSKSMGTKRLRTYLKIFHNAHGIICNSSFTWKLIKENGVDIDKIKIVTPMVDHETYHPHYDVSELKKNLSIKDEKIILSVGRLAKRKGHSRVISNLNSIISIVGKVKYVIVGTDVGEGIRLKKLANDLGVEKMIIFAGQVPAEELPKYYCLCDVMVLPNYELSNRDNEGFGMVFLEANSCGKPVVGGLAGGTSDAVLNNESGLLVDANDRTLVDAVAKILTDESYARKMGEIGRERALKNFNWTDAARSVRAFGIQIAMI